MIDGVFMDQVILDSRALKDKGSKEGKEHKARKACKRVVDQAGMKRYITVGSKAWNERYLEYEWNGHEFCRKQKQPLLEFMKTVKKRREVRRNKFFAMFGHKAAEECQM